MPDNRRTASFRDRWPKVLISIFLFATFASCTVARADSQNDMLVFLSLESFTRFSSVDPELDGSHKHATADFLFTHSSDRFRFLAEYIWSNKESELERLQAAWEVDSRTMLWFGRFHSISNFWTTEYHHGQFMQTSISRPSLEEWEDESGPMPSHVTGIWLEREMAVRGQTALSLGIAAGFAPKFAGQELVPFDILDPDNGHDLSASGRLVYRPDVLSMNQIGLALAYNDIAVVSESSPNLADLNSIRQATFGLFADWHWKSWRLSTNWVYFDNEMFYRDGVVNDDFVLAYIQGEYQATEDWTIFGRTEFGLGEDESPYLQLLTAFIAHRSMIGVRWDFADSQGLTLEVADTAAQGDSVEHDSFKEIRIQWSAVFP